MTTRLVSTGFPTSVLIFRFQVFPPTPRFPPPLTEKHHTEKQDKTQKGKEEVDVTTTMDGAVLEIVRDVPRCSKEFLFPSSDLAELGPSSELKRWQEPRAITSKRCQCHRMTGAVPPGIALPSWSCLKTDPSLKLYGSHNDDSLAPNKAGVTSS